MPEKHTPIVSRRQAGLFGAELARKRAGKKTRTGMSEEELSRHLHESKGKDLPASKMEKQGFEGFIPRHQRTKVGQRTKQTLPSYSPSLERSRLNYPEAFKPRMTERKIESTLASRINKFVKSVEKAIPMGAAYGIATHKAKKLGHKDFSEGSAGEKARNKIVSTITNKSLAFKVNNLIKCLEKSKEKDIKIRQTINRPIGQKK